VIAGCREDQSPLNVRCFRRLPDLISLAARLVGWLPAARLDPLASNLLLRRISMINLNRWPVACGCRLAKSIVLSVGVQDLVKSSFGLSRSLCWAASWLIFIGGLSQTATALAEPGADYFSIRVVDDVTGRGVPMVELRTVNNIRYYTDSAGLIAINEPGLVGQKVYFHLNSHGYQFPKDGFGYRGTALAITLGEESTLKMTRINIAERLYRVTGAGIYRDTVLVGKEPPVKRALLNGQVFGSDSVVNAVFNGKIYWFWGDTNRASYPLGNFHVPGATSRLPADGGLDPETGIDLNYFLNQKGFAKPTAKMPGNGPTWINGLVTVKGAQEKEELYATYVKIKPPLSVYQKGLVRFNEEEKRFEKITEFDLEAAIFPFGHPLKHKTGEVEYVYFGNPFPLVRVPANANALKDLSAYEAYTCLRKGSREGDMAVERKNGSLIYQWKKDTIPFTPKLQARLVGEKKITSTEGLFQIRDDQGKLVTIQSGSIGWNSYRQRWIMIGVQSFGSSYLGEVWYAESRQLTGPWLAGCKIATHEKYSFYNPKQHKMFDKENGRYIFFEGTYTNMFSGNTDQTPRYDYNQIMYKLDLAHPVLKKCLLPLEAD
jgi:hypothetical protein